MTHREKVDFFVADLARRGVSEYTSAPPAWRAAWGLGLRVPPPHFLSPAVLGISSGLFFGVGWSTLMYTFCSGDQ